MITDFSIRKNPRTLQNWHWKLGTDPIRTVFWFQGLAYKSCFIAKKEAWRNWNRIIWDWLCISMKDFDLKWSTRTGLTIAWIKWGWGNPRINDTSDPTPVLKLLLPLTHNSRWHKETKISNKIWLVDILMASMEKVYAGS